MKKRIGYALLVGGFIAAALCSVMHQEVIFWISFIPCLIAAIVGIAIIRVTASKEAREEGKLATNIANVESALVRILENLKGLNAKKDEMSPYDVRHELDRLLVDDLTMFVDERRSIAYVYSLQDYGDIMSHFAAGERYLNRTWTASADGYVNEVKEYLVKAHEQFEVSLSKLATLRGGAAAPEKAEA
jgi:hypothetical protein